MTTQTPSEPAAAPVVLIVDDSSTIRTTAKIFLKDFEEQIKLEFAQDGFEAARMVGTVNPSLILADVLMPRLSGYQLCYLVKQHPKHRHVPFYILSSKDTSVDKALGTQCGADGYMVKPFNKPGLFSLIEEVLGLTPSPATT